MSEEMKTREAHIATVAEMGAGGMRVLMPHPPGSTDHLPVGTKLYAAHMDGPQLGGRPEDLRNTLCAVIELFGIDGAQKVTEYVLKHRGINAFDGTKVAALSRLDAGEVCVPAPTPSGDTIMKSDVEKMIREWQAECADHPALHNQGNVLLDRLKGLPPTLAMNDFLTGMDALAPDRGDYARGLRDGIAVAVESREVLKRFLPASATTSPSDNLQSGEERK